MKLNVVFQEEGHKYFINGIEAVSVTTVMKEIGIGKNFDDVSDLVAKKVEAAKDRGNYYDLLAEEAINDPFELNEWQERFLQTLKDHQLEVHQAQVTFASLKPFPIAGRGDFKGRNIKTGHKAIIDLKATYMIYKNDVKIQTNIYSHLDAELPAEHEVTDKFVIHYNEKTDTFTVMELGNIKTEIIESMLEAYQLGDLYVEANPLAEVVNMQVVSETFDMVKEFERLLKEEQEKLNNFYESIKKHMKEKSIKTFDLENFKITYTPVGTRTTVNYSKIAEKLNTEEMKKVNDYLVSMGKEPVKIHTTEEVKVTATEKEKADNSSVSTVKDRLTVTDRR